MESGAIAVESGAIEFLWSLVLLNCGGICAIVVESGAIAVLLFEGLLLAGEYIGGDKWEMKRSY